MEIIESWPLTDTLKIAHVDSFPKEEVAQQARLYLSADYPMLSMKSILSKVEIDKLQELGARQKDQYSLRLVVLDGERLVGWTHGWQDSVETDSFFMGASLILPEFRRKGLYSTLASKVLEMTKEMGFQSIWSMHVMTNNSVLIAKLKMDFNIFGFEVNTKYGALVRLVYHHNDFKRKVLKFRAGSVGDTDVFRALPHSSKSMRPN